MLAPMLSNLLGSMSEIRCSSQCASSISTSYCSSNSILLPECADAEAASVEKRESLACGMSSSSWSLEDLEQYIIEANLNVDDFGVTKEKDAPGAIQQMGTGTVTVLYEPTGIARHYRDGVVPPPTVEFERELKMNIFKTQ